MACSEIEAFPNNFEFQFLSTMVVDFFQRRFKFTEHGFALVQLSETSSFLSFLWMLYSLLFLSFSEVEMNFTVVVAFYTFGFQEVSVF